MRPRTLVVISDLHLGGDPTDPSVPGGRGFQMNKMGARLAAFIEALAAQKEAVELVIAGDFVDFLAEHPAEDPDAWTPFHREGGAAAEVLRRVIEDREPAVFKALARLLDRGHRLVILLGNHDIELSLPASRALLLEALGAGPGRGVDLELVLDNEAYVVGDLIIEHGNRSDPMNQVDHGALRRVRVVQSRGADVTNRAPFTPPVGSRVVADLMNPLKANFPFIDLLKPEAGGMAPVLLALHPLAALKLPRLLRLAARGLARQARDALAPAFGSEISGEEGVMGTEEDPLRDQVEATLPPELAAELLAQLGDEEGTGLEIAGGGGPLSIDLLRRVLAATTRSDRTFETSAEQGAAYRKAAEDHVGNGFRVVVFGHTHAAVCEPVVAPGQPAPGLYLNTGTWADLMRVPPEIHEDPATANAALGRWLREVGTGKLEDWILQRPTYALLRLGEDDKVRSAELCELIEADPFAAANHLDGWR